MEIALLDRLKGKESEWKMRQGRDGDQLTDGFIIEIEIVFQAQVNH